MWVTSTIIFMTNDDYAFINWFKQEIKKKQRKQTWKKKEGHILIIILLLYEKIMKWTHSKNKPKH